MKIEEKIQVVIPGVSEWAQRLSTCSNEEFLRELQGFDK